MDTPVPPQRRPAAAAENEVIKLRAALQEVADICNFHAPTYCDGYEQEILPVVSAALGADVSWRAEKLT